MKRLAFFLLGMIPATVFAGPLLDVVQKDSTDRSVEIYIFDDADGSPETGVEHNTAGIDLWYRREGGARVAITEAALASLSAAHADGGIEHIDNGEYRLDLPDAAFTTGANYVAVGGTVTGMIVRGGRVRLTDWDLETALDTSANIADGVLDELLSGHSTAGSLGQAVTDILDDTGTSGVLISDGTGAGQLSITGGFLDWNGNWDAEVQSEVDDVVQLYRLDHVAGAAAGAGDVVDDSIIAQMLDDSPTASFSNFNNVVHSLKRIGDQFGVISDLGSGPTIGANLLDLENIVDDIGASGAGLSDVPYNTAWNASINAQVDLAIETYGLQNFWANAISTQPTAGSFAADLTEDDGGTQRFTTNALEQGPSGGGGGVGDNLTRAYFVDTSAAGADTGEDWADAFDTIAEATAVAQVGDTIYVANGTYTEQVSMPRGVAIVGEDRLLTHITTTADGAALQAASGCTIQNLRITHTGTGSNTWGIDCSNISNVTLIGLHVEGKLDGIIASSAAYLRMRDCYVEAEYDAIACAGVSVMIADGCTFASTADYLTGDADFHAAYIPNITSDPTETTHNYLFRVCIFKVIRTAASSFETEAIHCPGSVVTLDTCTVIAKASDAGNTGAVHGIGDTAAQQAHLSIKGGVCHLTNAGTGTDYDISLANASSTAECGLFDYDRTNILGNVVDRGPGVAAIETAVESGIDDKLPGGTGLIAKAGVTNEDLDDISATNTSIPVLQHDIARPFVFRMSRRSDGQLKAINKIRLSNLAERPRVGFEMSPWMQAKPSGVTFAVLDSNGDATTDLVVSSDVSEAGARDYLVMTKITSVVAAGTYTVRATVTGADTSVVVAEGSVIVP